MNVFDNEEKKCVDRDEINRFMNVLALNGYGVERISCDKHGRISVDVYDLKMVGSEDE